MDFDLTEDQRAFQETARAFARERLAPHASRWDEEKHFPAAELREAAGKCFSSSQRLACGASRSRANARAVSWNARWSSVR